MATESPKQRSDEATLTSPAELQTININNDSQNADLNQPQVNSDIPASAVDEFENKHISDIVDDLVNSTEVSISGGSDNEATRSDASKGKGDGKGHGRVSSSTKKPASFKSINVNKTFLTSKAPTPGAPPRVAEKTAAATTTMASAAPGAATSSRPRLVAKTGSGLVSKGSGAQGGKPAPDASAVWNKNRPVPPPEPKKYTDEELKKYGIHMATRLQSDATTGQSNWADIDDDDEDWDPDTITWKDGTKVAIALPEEPAPAPPPEPLVAQPAAVKENVAPASPALVPALTERTKGPGPTAAAAVAAAGNSPSIKPGVLGSGKGLVLKGAVEKPTLVAKPPPPPTPAKSPWATLPKIDKVSPIVSDASPHGLGAAPRSGPPRDGPTYPPHGQLPTKEIAADDFSRAPWRDGGAGGANANRELFNSQSGRYEPVHDRRGPMRQEQQYGRQPAVMQRPLHEQQQGHGHMEYAGGNGGGGYQAGRNNEQQQGPYGRRRGSSNVSGGSGGWQRPLHPSEFPNARRPSMAGASDVPVSPSSFAPSVLQGGPQPQQGWPPGVSPGPTHATPYQGGPGSADGRGMLPPAQSQPVQPSPSAAPAVPVTEDDYELQKRLMRERRELAMRRRQEEEAKEEAARKERIRLKLEALGPAPESNKAKKAAVKDQPPVPAEIQSRVSATSEKAGLGPAESADGESEVPRVVIPQPAAKQLAPSPNGPAAQQQQPQQGISSPDSGVEPRLPSQGGASNAGPAHAWGSAPRQTERAPAVWGPQPSSTKNVWAAPSTNRALGNGTFAADLGTTPSIPAGPGPIAPPSRARAGGPQSQLPPIGPPRQPQGSRGGPTSDREREREISSNDYAAAVQADDEKFMQALNSHQGEWERGLQADGRSAVDSQPTIKETWRPTKLDETGARTGGTVKQTVHVGQEKAPSPVPTASASVSAPGSAPVSEYGQLGQGSSAAPVAPIIGARTASTQGRGGSRFFPARDARHETRDIRLEPSQSDALPRHISPSPPPPDTDGHPAFDGDASHPHVSLPRPYPVVRLPPSASAGEEPSKTPTGPANKQGPSFAWASQPAYKDAEKNAPRAPASNVSSTKPDNNGWQARIDSLLGGRKVHPSSARSATTDIRLEKQVPTTQQPTQQQQQAQPQQQKQQQRQHEPARTERTTAEMEADKSVTTKGMAEECFEEQEMGSLPPIRFPKTVPEMAWQPSPAPKPLSKKLWPVVLSADPLTFPVDVSGAGNVWRVCLPGGETKSITVPFGRARSNPRRGGPRGGGGGGGGGGRHSSSGQQGRGKGRDGATSYAAEQRAAAAAGVGAGSGTGAGVGASGSGENTAGPGSSGSNNTSTHNSSNNNSSSHGRGHRGGGYRGRDNWSRNGPAQVQT